MNNIVIFLLFVLTCSCQSRSSFKQDASTQVSYLHKHENFTQRTRSTGNEYFTHHPNYSTHRYYQPVYPVKIETFQNTVPHFQNFIAQHGYNSEYRPLIGIVTESQEDILDANELLVRIQTTVTNPKLINLMTSEVLTKVIAYRSLRIGQTIPVPVIGKSGKPKLIVYEVNKVFDLGGGMPAFGLVPHRKKAPPILLFRGTDFSLRGSASVLADLDLSGPGLTAFHSSQEEIHQWLYSVSLSHSKARVMGYSLGGSFTQYTCIYEHELVCSDPKFPSIAFNQPGVSTDLVEKWYQLSLSERPPLKGYITEGDLVPTVGKLIGDVRELSLDHLLEPLFAHVTLMSIQQRLYTYKIDVTLKHEMDYSVYDE